MSEREEYEHVPWSELAADARADRRRLGYLAGAVMVAAAIGLVAARALWPASTAPAPATGAGPVTTSAQAAAADAGVPPAAPATTRSEPGAPALYSEADLLAAATAGAGDAAVMKAEWFVVDYFTADRDPRGSLDIRTALPGDAPLPDLPHDGPVAVVTYVEWARAYRVEELGDGLHRVAVAFRAVAGADGEPLVRLPVRAVELVVRSDGAGVAVVDLPAPATLPLDVGFAAWPDDGTAPPPEVESRALRDGEAWGDDPAVVSTASAAGGWRVVVSVADDAGARWPLALWYDDIGPLAIPPWTDG